MNDLLLLALLTVAVAAGWSLGRRNTTRPNGVFGNPSNIPSQYYRGLNFLLDGSQNSAIDAFTRALEVNTETFDTHIALGNVLRRRGEVERAIRIHQNLLARPSLPVVQLHLAHLELARDYISAGLLDRAERLLLDLVAESGQHRRVAQRHLLEIYEAQRDWQPAREVAESLLPKRSFLRGGSNTQDEVGQPIPLLLAHYCCEQAEAAIARNDWAAGRDLLQQALKYDRQCVRASLMTGELEIKAGHHAQAINALKAVRDQDPEFVAETAEPLREAMSALDKRSDLRTWLESCFREHPTTPLVLAIAEEVFATEGEEAAKVFLRDSLREKPSLRGLAMLMTLHSEAEAGDDESLELDTIHRLIEARSSYRCSHCGFHGQQLHWHCPGCKHWSTVRDLSSSGERIRD